LKEYYLRF